jgi:uncharacterized protein (DUF302 family)
MTIVQVPTSFDETLQLLRDRINLSGMLLLHEINTKEILQKHGIRIADFRQLLFFHPNYMNRLLEMEPHAALEVPLKIIVRELDNGRSEFWFKNADVSFGGYSGMKDLANELDKKIQFIVEPLLSTTVRT